MNKIKCPTCHKEVRDGNFCEQCGAKLKEICNCWGLKKQYNCHSRKCLGYSLLKKILKSISNHKLETVTLIASLVSLYISMYR